MNDISRLQIVRWLNDIEGLILNDTTSSDTLTVRWFDNDQTTDARRNPIRVTYLIRERR